MHMLWRLAAAGILGGLCASGAAAAWGPDPALVDMAEHGCFFFRPGDTAQRDISAALAGAQAAALDKFNFGIDARITVEGYGEAALSRRDAYDQGLRRAEWAKGFLVNRYRLDPHLIETVSYGNDRPMIDAARYYCGARVFKQ